MDFKRDQFFSNSNFNLIYNLLSNDINKRFSKNIQNDNELKNILFSNMTECYETSSELPLRDININTIKTTAPLFYSKINSISNEDTVITTQSNMIGNKEINNYHKEGRDSEMPIRDISLNKKIPEYTNIRPQFDNNPKDDINVNFEKLNNERIGKNDPKKEIDFTLPVISDGTNPNDLFDKLNIERQKENVMIDKINQNLKNQDRDNREYQNQVKSMSDFEKFKNQEENLPDEEFQTKLSDLNNKFKNLNTDNKKLDKTVNWEDSFNINEIQKRNQLDTEIRNNHNDFDQTIIYKNEIENQKQYKLELEKENTKSNNEEILINYNNLSTKLNKNFLEITSFMRSYDSTFNNRYSFRVVFSPGQNEFRRYPMFYNNPTILATKEQAEKGQRGSPNTTGWKFSVDGEIFPAYNPSEPYGQIVGYEEILFQTSRNIEVGNIFRNIRKIRLIELIIPCEYLMNMGSLYPLRDLYIPCLTENYLLVEIVELSNVYSSSSNEIVKSFAKVNRFNATNLQYPYLDTFHKGSQNYLGAVSFRINSHDVEKTFFPSPLASLGSLTIRILKPNGELLNTQKDHVSIRCIEFINSSFLTSKDNKYFINEDPSLDEIEINKDDNLLRIKLNEYVSRFVFPKFSKIIINDYIIPTDQKSTLAKDNFESFINNSDGHIISYLNSNNKDSYRYGYIDEIIINSQGNINLKTGDYEINNYGSSDHFDQLKNNLSNIYKDLENKEISPNWHTPYGVLTNTSLQSSLSFEITTEEGDTSKIKTKII